MGSYVVRLGTNQFQVFGAGFIGTLSLKRKRGVPLGWGGVTEAQICFEGGFTSSLNMVNVKSRSGFFSWHFMGKWSLTCVHIRTVQVLQ